MYLLVDNKGSVNFSNNDNKDSLFQEDLSSFEKYDKLDGSYHKILDKHNLNVSKKIKHNLNKYAKRYDFSKLSSQDLINLIVLGADASLFVKHFDPKVREAAALSSRTVANLLKYDHNGKVLAAVAHQKIDLEHMLFSEHEEVLVELVKQGYGINILAHSKFKNVKLELVKQGYLLNDFKYDTDLDIQKELIKQDQFLGYFEHSQNDEIKRLAKNKISDIKVPF